LAEKKIDPYKKLLAKYKETILLNNAIQLLYWDMETYMPKGGIEQRSEEIAFLSGLAHERSIDPEIGSLLTEIQSHEDYKKRPAAEKRNVYLIQRDYDNISEEEYIREAYNDSLRNQKLSDLPKFTTFAGRNVYGGGGIYPDIWLEDKNENPTKFVLNLYYDSNRYLYSF